MNIRYFFDEGFPRSSFLAPQAKEIPKVSLVSPPGEAMEEFPQIISIYSPKGGVGKTHLAVNLAVLLSGASKQPTILLDLDLEFGNAGRVVGGKLAPNVLTLINEAEKELEMGDYETIKSHLFSFQVTGLDVLLGPPIPEVVRIHKPYDLRSKYEKLLQIFRDNYRYLILDCSVSLANSVTHLALIRADYILMVMDMDLSTLENGYLALNTLKRAQGLHKKVGVVLNRCPRNGEGSAGVDFGKIREFFKDPPCLKATIPYAPQAVKFTNLGLPYILLPDKEYKLAFVELVKEINEHYNRIVRHTTEQIDFFSL